MLTAPFTTSIQAYIMNWFQFCAFTENFAKLLDNGIMFDRAIEVASGSMTNRANRRFVGKLRGVFQPQASR